MDELRQQPEHVAQVVPRVRQQRQRVRGDAEPGLDDHEADVERHGEREDAVVVVGGVHVRHVTRPFDG
jgi:hypothetical protein